MSCTVTNRMSYTVYSSRYLMRKSQTGHKEDPRFMLYVLLVLMYMLALIFLSFHLFDLSTMCAALSPCCALLHDNWK